MSDLVVYQQFRALEVSGSHSHVVLLGRVVELCKTPVYQTELRPKNRDQLGH